MRPPSSIRRLALAAAVTLAAAAALGAQDFSRPRPDRAGGRYQLIRDPDTRGWIILDSETGTFDLWIRKGDRFGVIRCHFGRGCPITEKRSESWGLDP